MSNDIEKLRRSPEDCERESHESELYPVTSYASQIGGGGEVFPEEPSQTKDPNLVDWDGPNDPANPYNWYSFSQN